MDREAKLKLPGEFDVVAYDVPNIVGDWTQLDYGDPHSERIAQLRSEFDFEQAVQGAESEFDAFLGLKRWVRSRWNHGWSQAFATVKDGLDVLRAAAEGNQFCCGHYNMVFRDCALALGWVTRGVGLSVADCGFPRDYRCGNVGHSVPEIWSNELRKWVLLDPDLNVYYARDGVPLSALEIRDAWLSHEADQVQMIQDQPEFVVPSGEHIAIAREFTPGLEQFDEQRVHLNMARFSRHRAMDYYARVTINGWEWVDERLLPTFIRHYHPGGGNRWTTHLPDMYWSVNTVRPIMRAAFIERGWQDATHQRLEFQVGPVRIAAAGVDDPHHELDDYSLIDGPPNPDADLSLALLHSPEPRVLSEFERDGYQLSLSGHTHGGQLCLPGSRALVTNCGIDRERVQGLHDFGRMKMHVSNGLGTSKFVPLRLFCRPSMRLATVVKCSSHPACDPREKGRPWADIATYSSSPL